MQVYPAKKLWDSCTFLFRFKLLFGMDMNFYNVKVAPVAWRLFKLSRFIGLRTLHVPFVDLFDAGLELILQAQSAEIYFVNL